MSKSTSLSSVVSALSPSTECHLKCKINHALIMHVFSCVALGLDFGHSNRIGIL